MPLPVATRHAALKRACLGFDGAMKAEVVDVVGAGCSPSLAGRILSLTLTLF